MKTTAKRTQIYLPVDLHREVMTYARGKRVPLAVVVRLSLADFLERHNHLSKRVYERDPLWRLHGAIHSREGDLSKRHDTYVYGRSTSHG